MNGKRFLGKALCLAGAPPVYGLTHCFDIIPYDKIKASLLWAVPLSIVTFPLLPLWFIGDKLITEIEAKEFSQRTKDLPVITLPKHYLWIAKIDDEWRLEPLCTDGEEDAFESETEARLFVKTLEYHEVISKDCQDHQTFWIKNDSEF